MNDEIIEVYYSNRLSSKISLSKAYSLIERLEAEWLNHFSIRLVSTVERKLIKQQVILRDDRICYICNRRLSEQDFSTVDHIVSKRETGPFHELNLKCCCYDCNIDKGSKSLPKYVQKVSRNKERYPWATKERLDLLLDIHNVAVDNIATLQLQLKSRPALSLE